MERIRSICVYCGSSPGKRPEYTEAAMTFARALASRRIRLVYGGANVGIMGDLANTMLAHGGKVIGIMPQALVDKEVAHSGLDELIVTQSMHERKSRMADLSDAFIALPGGIGTLEELFEIWTWAQLGFHQKPCGILNTKGYFDSLLLFLDEAVEAGFVKKTHRKMLICSEDPEELLEILGKHRPPVMDKWVTQEDL